MYAVGLAIVGLCPLIRLIDVKSIPILIVSSLIAGVGSGFAAPLNYGIQADNTDYVEMTMGIRAEGAVASLSSFISKCAMGIGGAIPGYMLQMAGFNAVAEVQTHFLSDYPSGNHQCGWNWYFRKGISTYKRETGRADKNSAGKTFSRQSRIK